MLTYANWSPWGRQTNKPEVKVFRIIRGEDERLLCGGTRRLASRWLKRSIRYCLGTLRPPVGEE